MALAGVRRHGGCRDRLLLDISRAGRRYSATKEMRLLNLFDRPSGPARAGHHVIWQYHPRVAVDDIDGA